ncbi:MAG: AMP-binding protein [Desulfuromonadales bacterium]|nr:AMP-binding protein [Desulfuromonadales bacterium]
MSLINYFDRGVLLHGDKPALISEEGSYTYNELKEVSDRVAAAIASRGDHDLSRLAVYSHNTIHIFPCLLGGMRAGNILVPANARDEVSATVHFLNLTKTKWFFYHSELCENVEEIRTRVPSLEHFVCLDKDNGADKSLARFIAEEGDGPVPVVTHDPHRHCYYYSTGGTTGLSKAVVLDNLSFGNFYSTFNWMTPTEGIPVHLCVAPISHTAGPMAMALQCSGVKNVVLPGFDVLQVLKAIEEHKVTHLFLPPTALYAMLAHPEVRNFDYSSLKYFVVAAAPVAPEKIREAIEVFGPCLCQCYGQAEAPGVLTWMPPEKFAEAAIDPEKAHLFKSCGQPTLGLRVAIMDDDGNIVPNGERGEIVAQGNLVSVGYLDNPEATAEIRQFGWHHTGDIGIMDDEGYFYIVDRKKDMIITGGFNVYPAEVEATLLTHPNLQDAAVVGVPDEKWGEMVKAVVTLKEGQTVTEEELIAFCREELGAVKTPKSIEFWDLLPRTAAGKISRKDIRKKYWVGQERSV